MSTKGNRNFRPAIHFTPPDMWMNDPNGMVYIDGIYHLFYQKHPYDTVWGPIYWGHAISRDLLDWEHLPIALHPDELGYIFSGSCIYDIDNTSGYGTKENPPVISLFTSHNGETGLEQQSLAYSTDKGFHFEKSYRNPVISNPDISDFRDPKVFWNPLKKCWSLVLAAYDRVQFYASENLKEWKKTGEFGVSENHASGVFECPDLFHVNVDDKMIWVLLVSMTTATQEGRSKTQYFVGDFDGNSFTCTYPAGKPLWADFGFDNYAGVTFQNYDIPLFIGWAQNWEYAAQVPTGEFCGQMTLARKLSVKMTDEGYRLCGKPEGLQQKSACAYTIESGAHITSETFGLQIHGNGDTKLYLKNSKGERLLLEIKENSISVDRTMAGKRDFHKQFMTAQYSKAKMKRLTAGEYNIELIFDVSVLEVFADEGLEMCTMLVYPETPYDKVEWQGELNVNFYNLI